MSTRPDDGGRSDLGLWVGLGIGAPVVLFGIWGVFADRQLTHPAELARWIVGLAVLNDLVLMPVVLTFGWFLTKVVPSQSWPATRWALVTTGALVLFSWPLVRGYGVNPTVPSLLPRNYGVGLVAYVGVVWFVTLVILVVAAWRRRGSLESGRTSSIFRDP